MTPMPNNCDSPASMWFCKSPCPLVSYSERKENDHGSGSRAARTRECGGANCAGRDLLDEYPGIQDSQLQRCRPVDGVSRHSCPQAHACWSDCVLDCREPLAHRRLQGTIRGGPDLDITDKIERPFILIGRS